jgi:hypothetical protein
MRAIGRDWLPVLTAFGLTFFSLVTTAHTQTVLDCEQAGRAAEQKFNLPAGLLQAIGRVESGRWDVALGRIVAWPWTIDVDGDGQQFNNSTDAINATRTAQAAGQRNIDVGCFQVSLLHHPDAFPDLTAAFDPQANALYAARFLASLQARLGNWEDATAAYHSATRELGLPYRERVFSSWSGASAISSNPVAQFAAFPGIHVWGPTAAGPGPQVVTTQSALPQSLPRVITPGG